MENGQCDCRRNLIGRKCSEVQPGFFCAPLDYYKYEAEDATGHSPGDPVLPVSSVPVYTNLFCCCYVCHFFQLEGNLVTWDIYQVIKLVWTQPQTQLFCSLYLNLLCLFISLAFHYAHHCVVMLPDWWTDETCEAVYCIQCWTWFS